MSTQITYTVNKVDKSRYLPGTNFHRISTGIGKPTEMDIVKYNKALSDFSLHWDYFSGITTDIIRIPRKNKRIKNSRNFDH